MTRREKISTLARAIGWTSIYMDSNACAPATGIPPGASRKDSVAIPDFFEDLNAIHTAVQKLDEPQKARFECILVEIVTNKAFDLSKQPVALMHYCDALAAIHASAEQKAEALLKTFNLGENA